MIIISCLFKNLTACQTSEDVWQMKREDIKHAEEITNDEIYDNMINTFVERIQEKTNDLVKGYDRDHNRQIKSEMNGFDFRGFSPH